MGWDVLKVINRGNASGAAFQTGMCGDIFDQFTCTQTRRPSLRLSRNSSPRRIGIS